MLGFKEDFDAWKATLTPEEQTLITEQANGEFNKKFRKSDTFRKDIPEEKMKSFAKVLGKFFEAEAEDYRKEMEQKTPDYDALLKKAGDKMMDFSLRNRIVEVDRDAERRYQFATENIGDAEDEGKVFMQSSPMMEKWYIKNDDQASHDGAMKVIKFMEDAAKDSNCPPDAKAYIAQWVKQGIPAVGQPFELSVPQVLTTQFQTLQNLLAEDIEALAKNHTEAEMEAFKKEELPKITAGVGKFLVDSYVNARDTVEEEVVNMKNFFKSQKNAPQDRTKADILKSIWAELPKHTDKPVPPLDDEMLAELAEEPAVVDGEYMHSWGVADKLYKSEAIDSFGQKYLLGIFETKEEATKAFENWNAEYNKARAEMQVEMEQWGKQEQARLDKDTSGRDRIKAVLEQARR